jgi:hypothetical protein
LNSSRVKKLHEALFVMAMEAENSEKGVHGGLGLDRKHGTWDLIYVLF